MLIAPKANPASITALQDLARPGVKVIAAQVSVPIGDSTNTLPKSASADPNYGANCQQHVERNVVASSPCIGWAPRFPAL